jgi:hypothetical protein
MGRSPTLHHFPPQIYHLGAKTAIPTGTDSSHEIPKRLEETGKATRAPALVAFKSRFFNADYAEIADCADLS